MLNGVERNRWTRFGALAASAVLLQSCGNTKLDFIKNGGGCAPEASAGTSGRCPRDVSACALGFVDHDEQSANGCETPLRATDDYALFAVQSRGSGAFVMNEYAFNVDVTGGWCAIKRADCQASPDSPCVDELVALQFQVGDFLFDSVKWTDGLFTLPKPLSVIDSGMGLSVPAGAEIIGTFTVGGQRQVISLGSVTGGILITTNGTQMSVDGSGLQLSYGGYTMEDMSVRFVANRVATAIDAGSYD